VPLFQLFVDDRVEMKPIESAVFELGHRVIDRPGSGVVAALELAQKELMRDPKRSLGLCGQ